MLKHVGLGLAFTLAGILTVSWAAPKSAARTPDKETPVSTLQIIVTAGDKDKPVDNASVYVRYEEPRFLRHPRKIELDLKTDQAGLAKVKDVPRVKVLIQVVKPGWSPFGEYYVLSKEEETIKIKLKPPAHWY